MCLKGSAKVALCEMSEPDDVLHREWLVQAHLIADRRDRRGIALLTGERERWVAGRDALHDFAKSSTHPSHASTLSPNRPRIRHMRPRFRQIFHASATCVHAFAKSSTHPSHASTLSPNRPLIRHMRRRLLPICHSSSTSVVLFCHLSPRSYHTY